MRTRFCAIFALVFSLCVQAGQAAPAKANAGEAIFCIGTPDGSCMEFGLVQQQWPKYAKHYPQPIVFTVGKSKLQDWPYIHPSSHDGWAGGKAHTFTINFDVKDVPAKSTFLILGVLAIWEPSQITISANGKQIASQRLPAGGQVGLSSNPDAIADCIPLVFELPAGSLKAGDNSLAISLNDGSWVIYDYVMLSTSRQPPKIAAEVRDLLAENKNGALAGVDEIVFATRQVIGEHWYANFGYYAPDTNRKLYREGSKLCKLKVSDKSVTTVFDDPKGGFRDPQIHYDGKKMVFAWRKGGTEFYHLYEANLDGSGLKQLTDGPWDDFEPSYLADGGLVFVSSRCKRWVNCWLTQVAVLHRCDADGGNIRPLSSNNEHDNTPWPLADGRILYTRWEYVDRSQVDYHHLWVANPDGSSQTIYYGNMFPGTVMIDAKPIPGTDKIVASFSPGHGQTEHEGAITIVDPNGGPDARRLAKTISRTQHFRDPWAFSEDCIMAVTGPSLVLMNGKGQTQELYRLSEAEARAGFYVHEPRPVIARPRELRVAPRTDPAQPTGKFLLADVNYGRNMTGVKPGEIKKLLVLETLPKPINYTGGMDPLSFGGTFTLERILGTVPVEPDGSAYFEVPALRSLFFVALDENDLAVKRMQSFVTIQPGETTSCAGCHEQRERTPRYSNVLQASRRSASKIQPFADVPEIIDYPRDVQPVLDALCVNCHGYEKGVAPASVPAGGNIGAAPAGRDAGTTSITGPAAGKIILSGDRGPMFSHSYATMTVAKLFSDGRDEARSNYPPRTLGSAASKILTMLDGSHYRVKATAQQKTLLRLWTDTGAAYPGTYAALGTGMIGGYAANAQVLADFDWPTTKAAKEVLTQRCVSCHKEPSRLLPMSLSDERDVSFWRFNIDDPRMKTSRHSVFNLTRPEKSLMVLAPLAENAGGWGLCRDLKTKEKVNVFADTNDAGYQKLLAMIAAGKQKLDEIKRFDMPGFQPRPEWVREMKRYGVLPQDLIAPAGKDAGATAPINVYEIERKYWESLWYQPQSR
ncbi:MAG TPA: polysaccharide lyase family protein [Planctomycetota bacterium]|jgi:hypothetical protein